jgi:hypothetical protein
MGSLTDFRGSCLGGCHPQGVISPPGECQNRDRPCQTGSSHIRICPSLEGPGRIELPIGRQLNLPTLGVPDWIRLRLAKASGLRTCGPIYVLLVVYWSTPVFNPCGGFLADRPHCFSVKTFSLAVKQLHFPDIFDTVWAVL